MSTRTMALTCGLLALAGMSAPAIADPRLAAHAYDPAEVVRVPGKLGVQATIAFGEGESIENVAVGNSQEWQITPNKRANLLFVKPLAAAARTNMTVVTDRHTYFFDLVAGPKAEPLYMLRFTYADEEAQSGDSSSAPGAPALAQAETAIMPVLEASPKPPAELNYAWRSRGDAALLPAKVYDDGAATYLSWSKDQAVPAILVRNAKGEEGPVNYAVHGSTIVVQTVPSQIILRTGDDSAILENMAHPGKTADVEHIPAFAPYRPIKPYFAMLTPDFRRN